MLYPKIGDYIFVQLAGGAIFAGWVTEMDKGLITFLDTENMKRLTQPQFITHIQTI